MNGPAVTRTELINKINEIIGLPLGGVPEKILAILGFTGEEIPFLKRADGLLVSHYGESISPTIAKIEALLPPEDKGP